MKTTKISSDETTKRVSHPCVRAAEWRVTERRGPRASVKRDMSHKHETYEFYIYRWLSPYSRILPSVTYFLYRYVYRTYVSYFFVAHYLFQQLNFDRISYRFPCKLFFSLASVFDKKTIFRLSASLRKTLPRLAKVVKAFRHSSVSNSK